VDGARHGAGRGCNGFGSRFCGPGEADKAFEALSTDEYAWRQQQAGPSEDGPRDRKIMLPDLGPQAQAARLARWEKVEQQLAAIRQDRLSPANRINFAVYKGQIDALLAAQRYRDMKSPSTPTPASGANWPTGRARRSGTGRGRCLSGNAARDSALP
jgi:uncharacterized protein (DUF885 family)